MARVGDSYIYREGTSPNTRTAINSKVRIFSGAFGHADLQQIDAAVSCGAPTIEIHTGCYADAVDASIQEEELARVIKGAQHAYGAGLIINAGHGLHYQNVQGVARIPHINELNIGHSIIAQAVFDGMEKAVQDMKNLMLTA